MHRPTLLACYREALRYARYYHNAGDFVIRNLQIRIAKQTLSFLS